MDKIYVLEATYTYTFATGIKSETAIFARAHDFDDATSTLRVEKLADDEISKSPAKYALDVFQRKQSRSRNVIAQEVFNTQRGLNMTKSSCSIFIPRWGERGV